MDVATFIVSFLIIALPLGSIAWMFIEINHEGRLGDDICWYRRDKPICVVCRNWRRTFVLVPRGRFIYFLPKLRPVKCYACSTQEKLEEQTACSRTIPTRDLFQIQSLVDNLRRQGRRYKCRRNEGAGTTTVTW